MTQDERALNPDTIYRIPVRSIDGRDTTLEPFRGQALLIVNVASKCGFTSQYHELEALYRRFHNRGFSVLGFPCNQFGSQEPGTEDEIRHFCCETYDVTFPLFAKIEVNGEGAHPLFRLLTSTQPGIAGTPAIKWNFTKFLVDTAGNVVERFAPTTAPSAIAPRIEQLLSGA